MRGLFQTSPFVEPAGETAEAEVELGITLRHLFSQTGYAV